MSTATKERPILFSGEMVRAVLAGRKTQTRRIVKFRDPRWEVSDEGDGTGKLWPYWPCYVTGEPECIPVVCPHGKPGDHLWVRETWGYVIDPDRFGQPDAVSHSVVYKANADARPAKWRPSIHMPRWASRITLEVTEVRVERLRQITPGDAEREGIAEYAKQHNLGGYWTTAFARLWDEINGPRGFGWGANPWVWVVSFTTQEPTR